MWPEGGIKTDPCPCCKVCTNCPGFQKVLTAPDAGYVLYRHTTRVEEINKKTGAIETVTDTMDDVFIVESTKVTPLGKIDFDPEIDRNQIKCPRCVQILKRAQTLLKNQDFGRSDVIGICEHCRQKTQTGRTCLKCEKAVKKFQTSMQAQKQGYTQRVKTWLSKIQRLIKTSTADDKGEVQVGKLKRRHSDVDINNLLMKISKTDREPNIKDLLTDGAREIYSAKKGALSERAYRAGALKDIDIKFYETSDENKFSHEDKYFVPSYDRRHAIDTLMPSNVTLDEFEIEKDFIRKYGKSYKGSESKDKFTSVGKFRVEDEVLKGRYGYERRHSAFRSYREEYDKQIPLTTKISKGYVSDKVSSARERYEDIKMKDYSDDFQHDDDNRKHDYTPRDRRHYEDDHKYLIRDKDVSDDKRQIKEYIKEEDRTTDHPTSIKESQKKLEGRISPDTKIIYESPTRMRRYHSEESLLTGMTKMREDLRKQKIFDYYFPVTKDEVKKITVAKDVSSSELIKDTLDKLKTKIEGEKKKQEAADRLKEERRKQLEKGKMERKGSLAEDFEEKSKDKKKGKSVTKEDQVSDKVVKEKPTKEKISKDKIPKEAKKKETPIDSAKEEKVKKGKEEIVEKRIKEGASKEKNKLEKSEKIVKEDKLKQEKPKQEKPKQEKPKQEKPKQEKSKDEKPSGEKSKDEKPSGEKSKEKKPVDEKSKDEKSKEGKLKEAAGPKDDMSKEKELKMKEDQMKLKLDQDAEERKKLRLNEEAADRERQKKELQLQREEARKQKLEDAQKAKEEAEKKKKEQIFEKPPQTFALTTIKMKKPSIFQLDKEKDKLKERKIPTPGEIKIHKKHCIHKHGSCDICVDSDLDIDVQNVWWEKEKEELIKDRIKEAVVGENIYRYKTQIGVEEEKGVQPTVFYKDYGDNYGQDSGESRIEKNAGTKSRMMRFGKSEHEYNTKGVVRYALSDRSFIEKGWTKLPTEKVVRKMNVYRMRPAHPEFNWFEHHKNRGFMEYDTGERLAEFDENGRGRWYYRSGLLALDYYDAEEVNAQQRFVVYSSGEPDQRGRSRPRTVLAAFDYLGNGIVFDHAGKIRLKYNQTEGVVLDRTLGPISHWKWHTLNDPPVLQQVMIDTQLAHKDPEILKLGGQMDNKQRPDDEQMLAIEFDNFIKEKSAKLTQSFKPFQIKMKALKINEYFSLRVLDQATVYLIFRDGITNIKMNIGMILDHKEIVDTDTAEVGEVSNNLERLPAKTDSLAGLQKSVDDARRLERCRTERDRRIRRPQAAVSVDRFQEAVSKPLMLPLRTMESPSGVSRFCKCRKSCNVYYDTSII
ncbi:uncharacterized protein LOC106142075 [Amyelois transitella]|uniref:uncharacterized protein LOC106142075 n=1 Tax=Amyelois transitella TaxID=680683 RepID=UPI00298F8C0C|nr:uncharacterized protein LOC106142075 [Amyelois transitella]